MSHPFICIIHSGSSLNRAAYLASFGLVTESVSICFKMFSKVSLAAQDTPHVAQIIVITTATH